MFGDEWINSPWAHDDDFTDALFDGPLFSDRWAEDPEPGSDLSDF